MKRYLMLLRFGEGGDGAGASSEGAEGEGTDSGDDDIPSAIPEGARKLWKETVGKKRQAQVPEVPKEEVPEATEAEEPKPQRKSYEELIKNEYKEEHEEYFKRTLNDRMKGVKSENSKMKKALEAVAMKYGIDSKAENFLDSLSQAIEADDSYYEQYAMDHDMTPSQARKTVSLERRAAEYEAMERARQEEEANHESFRVIQMNSEKTKAKYENFDLMTELKDARFVQALQAFGGDTTFAYEACHHNEILQANASRIAEETRLKTSQAISSGSKRPIEGGLGSAAPTQTTVDYSKWTRQQLEAQAEIWRNQKRR